MLFLLTSLLLVLHGRVRISPTTVLGMLLLLSAILLLWMVLVLIVLLLRIAVTDPVIVAVRRHHVVGIINIGSTAATAGSSVSNCGVRMGSIRIGLQLYSSSTPKIGIRLFLLPIPVGGLAPGGGGRLLLVAVTVVRRHRV